MPSLIDLLAGQLQGSTLDKLGSQLGTDSKTTSSAVSAALPLLLGALTKNASSSNGARALNSALERDHDGGILDDVAGFLGQGQASMGAGILKHVLGGRQSAVESSLSRSTGMDSASVGKLLGFLAPMVMGALGKQQRTQGLDAAGLAGMLTRERDEVSRRAPAQMGALNSLLDTDGDGDVDLGDLAKGAGTLGKLFGGK